METAVKTVTDFDIFNKIKDHLISQNARCLQKGDYDDMVDCAYRGLTGINKEKVFGVIPSDPNRTYLDFLYEIEKARNELGLPVAKCAVGAIIEDQFYDLAIEGKPVTDDGVKDAIKQSNPDWEINYESVDMLKCLQSIHDDILPHTWVEALNYLSKFFNENGSWTGYGDSSDIVNDLLDSLKVYG